MGFRVLGLQFKRFLLHVESTKFGIGRQIRVRVTQKKLVVFKDIKGKRLLFEFPKF